MTAYKQVVVSQEDLASWALELSEGEKSTFGNGSAFEMYLNWAHLLGWRLSAMTLIHGPGLVPTWSIILDGEGSDPYPNDHFRPHWANQGATK